MKNSAHGCDGSYPELTNNRLRCVSSLEYYLESKPHQRFYTQLLTLPFTILPLTMLLFL